MGAMRIKGRRRVQLAASRRVNRFTASLRPLPDFLILGAQKSGTTSLYHYMGLHPALGNAITKEVHYFDRYFHKGVNWYKSHFPIRQGVGDRQVGSLRLSGEATPYYLFHPLVPKRARDTVPDARLIVILRDPVQRALSHYHHELRAGRETLSFKEALRAEPSRLADEADMLLDNSTYHSRSHQHHSYLARGRYAEQLRRWLQYFPREQILVLRAEDFYCDAGRIVGHALDFLGLSPLSVDLRGRRRYQAGSYAPMPAATRAWLREYFEPHNRELYGMLGVDFGWEKA